MFQEPRVKQSRSLTKRRYHILRRKHPDFLVPTATTVPEGGRIRVIPRYRSLRNISLREPSTSTAFENKNQKVVVLKESSYESSSSSIGRREYSANL